MKHLLFFLCSTAQFVTFSQCTNCLSIQEALKFPEKIVHLNLRHSPMLNLDSTINNFVNLKEIDLSYSFVRTFDPTVQLNEVRNLNLSHSNLSPWTLETLDKNFPHLKELNLKNANLYFLPNKIGNLNQLTELDLSGNKLTSLPSSLEQLQQLTSLDLSNNDLKNQLNVLGYLWKLKSLNLLNNPKLNLLNVLVAVSENTNLNELGIDASSLTKEGGQLLSKSKVNNLTLNDISSKNAKFLKHLPAIKQLSIQNSVLQDVPSLCSKFPNLSHLILENSTVSAQTFDQLNIDQLTVKSSNPIVASHFKTVKKINVLDLSECEISENELAQLKMLLPKTKIIANSYGTITEPKNSQNPIVEIEKKKHTISSEVPTVITEKNATFEIPQNAFLTTSGKVYSGPVNIEVKVYEDALELLLDGAPMTYVKDGVPELFGSNAMLYFNATSEKGEQLAPNPDALINVEMRNNIPGTLGDMYQYDEAQQNWRVLPNTPVTERNTGNRLQQITDSINALDVNSLFITVNNDRKYSLKVKHSKYDQTLLNFTSEFKPIKTQGRTVYYNRFENSGKELCKQQWAIDTIVNAETRALLKTIQKETRVKYSKGLLKSRPYFPKKIWNISVVQDYESDHYRLKFNFKDSLIDLPIAIAGKSTKHIQQQHKQFQTKLARAEKKDAHNKKQFDKFRQSHIDKNVEEVRRNLIAMTLAEFTRKAANESMMRFGLTEFKLVNWDILVKVKPDELLALQPNFTDQNGNSYETPRDLRVLLPVQNSYFSVRNDAIPLTSRSAILIVRLEDNKLGVLPLKRNLPKKIEKMTVLDISNLDPTEVSKLILSQNALD